MDRVHLEEINSLLERVSTVVVCSIREDGFPNAKAMFKIEHDGLTKFYLSTNTSSERTQQFMKNPKACIYFYDASSFHGVMLVGNMEVRTDRDSKARLWREGFEIYYPKGIEDEDYCVLEFVADHGNYYHGLNNFDFTVSEIEYDK